MVDNTTGMAAAAATTAHGVIDYLATLASASAEKDAEIARLRELIGFSLDVIGPLPDPGCTCHLSAPCGDCERWAWQRTVVDDLRAARDERPEVEHG